MKSVTTRILAVIAVVSIIINVLQFFRYSTSRPLVTIGQSSVTKKQYLDQMEHDNGQAVLTKLVFSSIVSQAAARAGVTPTDADVTDRIQLINRRAPQLLVAYNQNAGKMAQFKQDLANSMALENLRIQNVALAPAQISDYYNRHRKDFTLPAQTLTTVVVTQNAVNAGTATDLLRANDPPDVIGRQTGLRVVGVNGYAPDMQRLPAALKQETTSWVMSAPVGAVKTFQTGAYYLTFRVTGKQPAAASPLAQVRGEVERAARLEAAPPETEELARLYRDAKPSFDADKYAAYFASVQQYPVGPDAGKKTADAP